MYSSHTPEYNILNKNKATRNKFYEEKHKTKLKLVFDVFC